MNVLTFIPTPFLVEELKRRGTTPEIREPAAQDAQDAQDAGVAPAVPVATRLVSRAFGVPVEVLLGRSRLAHISRARFAAWLLLEHHGLTYVQIAGAFHREDPGTVRHGCQRGRQIIREDKRYARHLSEALATMDATLKGGAGTAR